MWVRLCVREAGDAWAAMIVADEAPPPGPGKLRGTAFFAEAPEEAEQAAKAYPVASEPGN